MSTSCVPKLNQPTSSANADLHAQASPACLLLLLMPLLLLSINDKWAFTPEGCTDAWAYFGHYLNLAQHLNLFGESYVSNRLSVSLPGYLAYRFLPPLAANYALRLGLYYASVLSLYLIVRWTISPRAGLLAGLSLGCEFFFLRAIGWDYVDGFGISYFLLTASLSRLPPAAPAGRAISWRAAWVPRPWWWPTCFMSCLCPIWCFTICTLTARAVVIRCGGAFFCTFWGPVPPAGLGTVHLVGRRPVFLSLAEPALQQPQCRHSQCLGRTGFHLASGRRLACFRCLDGRWQPDLYLEQSRRSPPERSGNFLPMPVPGLLRHPGCVPILWSPVPPVFLLRQHAAACRVHRIWQPAGRACRLVVYQVVSRSPGHRSYVLAGPLCFEHRGPVAGENPPLVGNPDRGSRNTWDNVGGNWPCAGWRPAY